MDAPKPVESAVADAKGHWARLQDEHPSVRHVAAAWALLERNRGSQFAAAITYFSFLALFPLVLLAVAALGFVLHAQPDVLDRLLDEVTEQVPGPFGNTIKASIADAIDARAGVGIVGLAGVLLTGLGWIANLRSAIDAVWGQPPEKQNWFKAKGFDLLVLAGLGLGVVISIGLTVIGTSVTDQLVDAAELGDVAGIGLLVKVLGIALAVAGDFVIFSWLLVWLPDVDVPKRTEIRGALLAAVLFEILKIAGSFTIAHTAASSTAGPFASLLAVLVWINLVARAMLFSCAWTSVVADETGPQQSADAGVRD